MILIEGFAFPAIAAYKMKAAVPISELAWRGMV